VSHRENNKEIYQICYIFAEKTHGTVEREGPFASEISYTKDGFKYLVWMDNDEFVIMHEVAFRIADTEEEFNDFFKEVEE
jgi:hypothetical protein